MSSLTSDKLDFNDFPPASYQDWRTEAEAALKGAPFEKKLLSSTPEGITIQPIYHRSDLNGLANLDALPGQAPYIRGSRANASWTVAQITPADSTESLRQALQHNLALGQNAIVLRVNEEVSRQVNKDFFANLFQGFDPSSYPVHLDCGTDALPFLACFIAWRRGTDTPESALTGSLDQDPISHALLHGELPYSWTTAFDHMASALSWINRHTPHFGAVTVQSHTWHDAGATATQELAYTLASAVTYLRELESRNLTVNAVAPHFRLSLSSGSDFFLSIAKFRAARLLWAKIIEASGGDLNAQKATIHARTSLWNRSTLDPHVNLLRSTTEALSATLGSCDSLHVGPFDEAFKTPDAFSQRLARNTQIILRDECHIGGVADPAGGSFYIETLTRELAHKSWDLFREIEASGGILQALADGIPQAAVQKAADAKAESLACRRSSLVGVNTYANLNEIPLPPTMSATQRKVETAMDADSSIAENLTAPDLDVLIDKARDGASIASLALSLAKTNGPIVQIVPLPLHRFAAPFERLRYSLHAAGSPAVFLANFGPLRQYKARADFSTGFFEVGGFKVISGGAGQTVEAVAKATLDSGAAIVVLCSTDETYPELLPNFLPLLKSPSKPPIVVLAGHPGENLQAYTAQGVEVFIHLRSNCLQILQDLARRLGLTL